MNINDMCYDLPFQIFFGNGSATISGYSSSSPSLRTNTSNAIYGISHRFLRAEYTGAAAVCQEKTGQRCFPVIFS